MKTSNIIVFFLIIILSLSLFGVNSALASNDELTEIESQQLKILKLSKIIERHPSTIELKEDLKNYTIGLELYQQSDYQQAISELLKVKYSTLNLPLYIKAQFILGDCYRKIEDWNGAIEVYKNLVVNDPILTDYSLFYLADTYHHKGDNYESIATFKKIIENFPHSLIIAEANYQVAQIYCELKDIDFALIYYKNILENSRDDQLKGKVLLELSEIYWQERRYIDSLNCLYEILEKNYRLKRNSEPEELLVKYLYKIKEDLKDIKIPYHIMLKCADILFKYRQYNMAEDLYMEIIKGFPVEEVTSEVYYKRARSLYYKGEYKKTINQCEEIIIRFTPSEITIKADYLIANSLRALGKSHLAMDRYKKIIGKYPESYYARQSFQRLAELYFQAKETEKGISTWRDLINRYPNSYEAMNSLWNLARYYTNNNAFSEALDCYHELAERFSQSSLGDDALYWEGKTLESMGLKEEARIAYEKLVQEYPLSYYSERVVQQKSDISFSWPIPFSNKEDFIDLKEFFKKYDKIEGKGQLALLKAELFKEINFYQESIVELRGALKYYPGNIYLLFELSDIYQRNKEYYNSVNYTEIIFSYLKGNHRLEDLPLELWQKLYPFYFKDIINKYALKYEIDPLLVLAMIREESRFNPWNESVAGARGLMQIIFSTGEWIAQKLNLEDFTDERLFSTEVNINLGCWYINYLKERFSNDPILMISGYNAGPGITSKWVKEYDRSDLDNFVENIPYSETREHIKKVMKSYQIYKKLAKILSEK